MSDRENAKDKQHLLDDDVLVSTDKHLKEKQKRDFIIPLLYCTIGFLSIALLFVGAVALEKLQQRKLRQPKLQQPDLQQPLPVDEDEEISIRQHRRSLKAEENLQVLGNMTAFDELEEGCESTLLLFRHCYDNGAEAKTESGDKHCSYQGFEQTHFLSTLFGDSATARWPNPTHLFPIMFHQLTGFNFRLWETLKPLSEDKGIELNNVWYEHFQEEFFSMLGSGSLCGQVSVAAVKHAFIPALAFRLGCSDKQGCPEEFDALDFDSVVQLKFVFNPPGIPSTYLSEQAVVFQEHLNNTIADEEPPVMPKMEKMLDAIIAETLEDNNATDTNTTDENIDATDTNTTEEAESFFTWAVYGSVVSQHFDPLAYSKDAGDYPREGATVGGRWQHL